MTLDHTMKNQIFYFILILYISHTTCYPRALKDPMHPYSIEVNSQTHALDQADSSTSSEPMHGFIEGDKKVTDWKEQGQKELENALMTGFNMNTAKNIILFVGDGMGVSTTSAARTFKAQQRNLTGNSALLSWETFPHTASVRTYNVDNQTPDSAGTATAIMSGIKTRSGVIGVNQSVQRKNCTAVADNEVKSALTYAQETGKWTGIISTARITHATPAAAYANVAERDWESDADLEDDDIDQDICPDIARQLIESETGGKLRVILGGGRKSFYPETSVDPEYSDENGTRKDGRNLTEEWRNNKTSAGVEANNVKYVTNQTDFMDVNCETVEYLMGLFEHSHMQYETDRDPKEEPSLTEMVEKSINILQRNKDQGYFLYVESGRIDHAHHANNAHKALMDTLAMQDAVQKAVDMTNKEETLIIVTADHSHVFTIAGYQSLDTDILGLADQLSDDNKPYTNLGYANGPGYEEHRMEGDVDVPRKNITDQDTTVTDYIQDAGILLDSETHAAEDVSVYALGPMSHLFHGVHEQSYIAHVMMYAACIGENKDHCEQPWVYPGCPSFSPRVTIQVKVLIYSFCFYIFQKLIFL